MCVICKSFFFFFLFDNLIVKESGFEPILKTLKVVYQLITKLNGDLNPDPCLPHPTSTYTCEVTITPRVYDGIQSFFFFFFFEKEVLQSS